MPELLAPAGTMQALKTAIYNGCDAVYLGMNKFGARAYAENFDFDSLQAAIQFAHLRNVKVYITMNTIVFEDELQDAYNQIDKLYLLGVDALIIQDLALLDYVQKHCPHMESHASTQMGIDDLYGTHFVESFGTTRVVLGRECSLEQIKKIKNETNVSVEVFVHGALCVSYSGNCLMSGLIGYRSGNRGRCAGSCRKPYELINTTKSESLGTSYILSMKDLKTIQQIHELDFIDSLKIEGRMKEPAYVANVIKNYRLALDTKTPVSKQVHLDLEKTFNRTFTKGYIFQEDKKDIINTKRPNHHGYHIGNVSNRRGDFFEITLLHPLNQNDVIRIDATPEINFPVVKLYDEDKNLIRSANKKAYIYMKEKARIEDKVYITKDTIFMNQIEQTMNQVYRRIPIDLYVEARVGESLKITFVCDNVSATVTSDFIIEEAKQKTITKEDVLKQINRLKDTPYEIQHSEITVEANAFLPSSKLNELRRQAIEELNQKRLIRERVLIQAQPEKSLPILFNQETREITCFCTTKEQYDACVEEGIETIYYGNYFRRNETSFKNTEGMVLLGGYNGIEYSKNQSVDMISDFSLNVVNAKAVLELHKRKVKRVTLSHEMNKKDMQDLINSYQMKFQSTPNLELIVYGHAHLLNTKYCPLKVNNLCGKCKTNTFVLRDSVTDFPIISHEDCTTTILNGKILNLLDDFSSIPNEIKHLRLQFTIESKDKVKEIIQVAKKKLQGSALITFNSATDTRGHFNREII